MKNHCLRTCCFTLFIFCITLASHSQTTVPLTYSPDGLVTTLITKGDTLIVGGSISNIGKYTGGGALFPLNSDQPDLTFPKINGTVRSSTPDGTGGFYIVGNYYRENENVLDAHGRIEHILADKTFEPGFSLNVTKSNYIGELLYHNGVLYIGCIGEGVGVSGQPIDMLAGWHLQSGTLVSWIPTVERPNYWSGVTRIVEKNNVLYFIGNFLKVGETARNGAAAIEIGTGTLKPWHPTPNWETFNWYNDIGFYNDKIILGGIFSYGGYDGKQSCAMVDTTDGSTYDYLFSSADIFEDDDLNLVYGSEVTRLIIKDDILIAFSSGALTRITAIDLTKVNLKTAPYKSGVVWVRYFNYDSWVQNMQVSGNDLILSGLAIKEIYNINEPVLLPENIERKIREVVRLDIANGSLRNWFVDPATSSGINVYTMTLLGDKIFIGGDFTHVNALSRAGIYMMDTKTQAILPFSLSLYMPIIRDMKLFGNTLYLAGDLKLSSTEHYPILSVDATTGAINNWHPDIRGESNAIEVNSKYVFIGGEIEKSASPAYRYDLFAIDRLTGAVDNWSPDPTGHVNTLHLWNDKLFVGGEFRHVHNQQRPYVASYNTSDLSLTNWVANPDTIVNTIYGRNGTIWVGSASKRVNPGQNKLMKGFDPITGVALHTADNVLTRQGVYGFTSKGCKLFIGGSFQPHGIPNCNSLTLYNLNDKTFTPNDNFCLRLDGIGGSQSITKMVMVGNDLYFGGWFTKINNKATNTFLGKITFPADYFTSCQIDNCGNALQLTSTADDTYDGTQIQKTNETITANNKVMGSSKVLMKSNKSIVLLPGAANNPGFTAKPTSGGNFKAEIGNCN